MKNKNFNFIILIIINIYIDIYFIFKKICKAFLKVNLLFQTGINNTYITNENKK